MITTGILLIFYTFINFILSLLPSAGSFPSSFSTALSGVLTYAHQFDKIVPVTTALTLLALTAVFQGGVLAFKFTNWIIGKIRGSN